jgi:hypothetical protein
MRRLAILHEPRNGSCNTATYTVNITIYVSQKAKKGIKVQFSITTFTSFKTLYYYKHLHWCKKNLYVMIVTYDIYNHHRLGSNGHLVIFHQTLHLQNQIHFPVLIRSSTLCNGFTERYQMLLLEYPFSRTSCLSLYKPYAYRALTLTHSLNACTFTIQSRGLEGRH